MVRAALGLLTVLACAGCATNEPQAATIPECRAAALDPGAPDSQDCPDQAAGQIGVHMSGMTQFGVGAVR
jgi:hypothetical protein